MALRSMWASRDEGSDIVKLWNGPPTLTQDGRTGRLIWVGNGLMWHGDIRWSPELSLFRTLAGKYLCEGALMRIDVEDYDA